MHWMHLNIYISIANKQPITSYLVRPLSKSKRTFSNQPLSTNALRSRLRHILEQLHINDNETLHSTRRGKAMHMEATGSNRSNILQQLVLHIF